MKGWEEIEEVLHHQGLPYIPKILHTEVIYSHHNNPLTEYFGIEKIWELIARK